MHRNRVFIDSSFWIAFRHERQTHHAQARKIMLELFAGRAQFVSTPLVFAEIHATFSRSRVIRERIIADFWENSLMHLADVTPADHKSALTLLREHEDKSYPFCDAVSFVVMRRLAVTRAAAFDDHFHQLGEFEILSAD